MSDYEKIFSRDNQRLGNARKVRDGKVSTQIFIEGRRLAEEALRSDLVIDECFVVEGFRDRKLIDAVAKRTSDVVEISKRIFGSIANTNRPQGIIIIAKRPKTGIATINSIMVSAPLPVVIFLKEINNPSNLGAIFRTAEAAGVAGLIVSNNSADVFSPKALRAAMGSSFRLAVWEGADFGDCLQWAKQQNLTTIAADAQSERDYTQVDWKTPRLLIFGSEAHGLADDDLDNIDETIRIPMDGGTESLNLAVSAGIILFEAKRQNQLC